MHTRARALALLLLTGCPSLATRQTAHPVPPGRWQLLASADLVTFRDREQGGRIPGAQVEVGARRGLVPDLDAGLKLHAFGLVGDVKWRFLNNGPWAMAVVPAFDLGWTPETTVTTNALHAFVHAALLVSHELAAAWQVTFGGKALAGLYAPDTGGRATGASLGLLGALDWRFTSRWHLVPEVNLYRSVAGEVPVRGTFLQAGLGVLVDF